MCIRDSQNPDLNIRRRQALQLTQQTVGELLGQRGAAGQDDAAVQSGAQVEIGALDRVDDEVVQTRGFETDYFGVEEDFGGAETFLVDLGGLLVDVLSQLR